MTAAPAQTEQLALPSTAPLPFRRRPPYRIVLATHGTTVRSFAAPPPASTDAVRSAMHLVTPIPAFRPLPEVASVAPGHGAFYGESRNRVARALSVVALGAVAAYWVVVDIGAGAGAAVCK